MGDSALKRKRSLRPLAVTLGYLVGLLILTIMILSVSVWGAMKLKLAAPTADAGWAQAIGAVLAIGVGFAGTFLQLQGQRASERSKEQAAGRAAYLLAYDALDTVSDRLAAALSPGRDKKTHALRGSRTTEMVAAMREFDTSRLPDNMLGDFIRLRSRVFAINARISEIYAGEDRLSGDELANEKARRRERLYSSIVVRNEAVGFFLELGNKAHFDNGASFQTLTKHQSIETYEIA